MGLPRGTGRGWRVVACALFAGSCLAILLLLWTAFGGALPLKPQGYRVAAVFPDGTQLAQQADVRISGVPVGRVVRVEPQGNRIRATMELDDRYVPLRGEVRAMLRAKSLLGETYVELTPGHRGAPAIREGATLPLGAVRPSVELDEIFRSLDARTRAGLRTWLQSQAASVRGRGADVSAAIGELPAFAQESEALLRALNEQQADVRGVVRDTGTVFAALTARDHELASLMRNAERATGATASRDAELRETFRALPRFNVEATRTLRALDAFSRNTDPVVTALHPAAKAFTPAARALAPLAPELSGLVAALGPLSDASVHGVPAATRFVDGLGGVLGSYDPLARQFNPILQWIGSYRRELIGFIANVVAVTQATTRPRFAKDPVHYARAQTVLSPEGLTLYDKRLGTNRNNPYPLPGTSVAKGIPTMNVNNCADTMPSLIPEPPDDPDPRLWQRINELILNNGKPAAPPCTRQRPFSDGHLYPHVLADASPPRP